MYDESPTTFERMISPFDEDVRSTALWLRTVISDAFPALHEGIHGGTKVAMALYGVGGQERIALGIQPGPRYVKLFIHDPDHLPGTSLKLDGTGKHMRHIKFRAPEESRTEELLQLMRVPVERRA